MSFRLVANQEPADVIAGLQQYVRDHTPPGIDVDGDRRRARRAALLCADGFAAVRAGLRALERAFGIEVLFTREGGSGPEADLAEILVGAASLRGSRARRRQNPRTERAVDMALLLKGAEASAYLWDELAAVAGELTAGK